MCEVMAEKEFYLIVLTAFLLKIPLFSAPVEFLVLANPNSQSDWNWGMFMHVPTSRWIRQGSEILESGVFLFLTGLYIIHLLLLRRRK